jgi:molybdopterin/thiamine biosynthesis adenylyltransferase
MEREAELWIGARDFDDLRAHLLQLDHDEHGAIILAGIHRGERRLRLLAREVHPVPPEHFIAGNFGYRQTSPRFVAELASRAGDRNLAFVAAHSHPGAIRHNALSEDDRRAHERLFPHLLDLTRQPVTGIALGSESAAGEVWVDRDEQLPLAAVQVVGPQLTRLTPRPAPAVSLDSRFDRQARLFGAQGQQIFRRLHVAVIGAGGGGSMIVEQLAHLGVGALTVVDFDVVKDVNLSRIVGATPADVGVKKIAVAERLVRRVDSTISFAGVDGDIADLAVAERLLEADFLFLATDTVTSRLVFNAIVHRYLVPGIQIGAKVDVTADGRVAQVYVAVRPVFPDSGCLECHSLIDPMRLQEEARTDEETIAQNYLNEPDVIDPSVISLNGIGASHAVTTMLFSATGLATEPLMVHRLYFPREGQALGVDSRRQSDCSFCSRIDTSSFALGDPSSRLPCRREQIPVETTSRNASAMPSQSRLRLFSRAARLARHFRIRRF